MTTMNEETAGQMLERLGADGMKWAEEFRLMAIKLGYSDMPVDWLVGWFANAIERGHVVKSKHECEYLCRDAVVPDAKPLPDLMLASYHEAVGWNACRKAMLSQRGED